MEKTIIILNGYPRVGKDYLIDTICDLKDIEIPNVSTVTLVKKAFEVFGYKEDVPEIKDAFRPVLSDSKDSLDKHLDNITLRSAYKHVNEEMERLGVNYGFLHSREPENIEWLVNICKKDSINVLTVLVDSDWRDFDESVSNHADENVEKYDYDLSFESTKDKLKYTKRVIRFIEEYMPNL
ncbi:hypothetical protein BPT24_049 [Tenacibaculum phage pT24]|uniref:Uncharacterized protein n=1 Tax=Tenacibaculum phage pT24 TaxID=1880590 RepID=A0A1B4XWI6_9CAUD|nr:hypothetical protein HYP10_gp049 [Tenacibaculum phage pT24]BAV39172.1 hypothetical protein BPT24_049 [Tenacibaculum phage pT24]